VIGIIDYGRGNLRSVEKAFHHLGIAAEATSDLAVLEGSRALVLPGVGAFDDAMLALRSSGLDSFILEKIDSCLPFMGICLGYQVLFESSEEGGEQPGLGVLKGTVRKLGGKGLKVPHMGWNSIRVRQDSRVLGRGLEGSYFYFVHSFYVDPEDPSVVLTETDYGTPFASGIQAGNLLGFQFHPEKSSRAGLSILKEFARSAGEAAA
jgi:glutamine amidotransferase